MGSQRIIDGRAPMRSAGARRLTEKRHHRGGTLRLMAEAEGYVMVRHKGAMPFTMSGHDWRMLPTDPAEAHRFTVNHHGVVELNEGNPA